MDIDIHGPSILFEIPIFGGIPITSTLLVTWGLMLVLTLTCVFLTRNLKIKNVSKRQAIAEFIVQKADNYVKTNMGISNMRYVPFISALFAMSIFSSLSSLIGLYPPTADLSTELGWALVVFILITFTKIKTNGLWGYAKGFAQPVWPMTPFNILGEVFTPISMSFRHFGNILSGSVISTLLYAALAAASHWLFGLLPGLVGDILGSIPFLDVGIPAVFSLYFDWFSSFMQAFIFTMLTMMYISDAGS
jgi:F-type H+-transporting ATPase subunit a